MSYFALALLSLMSALALMVAGFGYPSADIAAPQTLIIVHLVAIGWLSLLLCGALFQFVPVLIARPLHSGSLPLPTLGCLAAGLVLLVCGFLHLVGWPGPAGVLPLGGALLVLGFALAIYNLGRTLFAARAPGLPARFVAVGLACLGATALLGFAFTLFFGGVSGSPAVAAVTAQGLPLHAVAGLGGWLTFTAIGVSYRLLAMFMLAPELDGPSTHAALGLGAGALTIGVLAGLVAILIGYGADWPLALGGLLGLAALALYGCDMIRLFRERKRRTIELNSRMAGVALVHLAVSVLLAIGLIATGALGRHVGALVFLVAFGWLTGLGLAKLYKIVAFLTWLECYGPVLGKIETPRVQDLVAEAKAAPWFWLYFAAADFTVLMLLAQAPNLTRLGSVAMLIAVTAIARELLRIRRLAEVGAAVRLPQGVSRPHLLVSTVSQP